jgi:hypothetical protein
MWRVLLGLMALAAGPGAALALPLQSLPHPGVRV